MQRKLCRWKHTYEVSFIRSILLPAVSIVQEAGSSDGVLLLAGMLRLGQNNV